MIYLRNRKLNMPGTSKKIDYVIKQLTKKAQGQIAPLGNSMKCLIFLRNKRGENTDEKPIVP